jgi:hypothetical protein
MKFSRSIIIFLFVSSVLGAFSYALNRTDGNIYKSFLFTLCFLAIKIGLIPPNVPLELNQSQPNQQLVSRVQPRPVYNPYVSVLYESRPSGLYMDHIQRAGSQYDLSYHSQSAITEIRAGDSYVTQAAWLLITIWMLQHQSAGFQPVRQAPPPPHLQWLYGNNYQPGQFGYGKGGGTRTIRVTGATQNAGSEKKDPSSGSWEYKEVMRELDRQSSRKKVEIEVGDQIYTIKNTYREDAYELGYKLADQIYDSIRECDTDICDIAKNLGFKADNIKNVKHHVFYNKHYLDRLAPAEPVEYRRFDVNIQQALAWKRLEIGTHTQDDVTWMKHECAERHHELKYGSGYSEAHDQAQSRFDGAPWEDQF